MTAWNFYIKEELEIAPLHFSERILHLFAKKKFKTKIRKVWKKQRKKLLKFWISKVLNMLTLLVKRFVKLKRGIWVWSNFLYRSYAMSVTLASHHKKEVLLLVFQQLKLTQDPTDLKQWILHIRSCKIQILYMESPYLYFIV